MNTNKVLSSISMADKPRRWRKGISLLEGWVDYDGCVVGVDPGVNFGLTIFNMDYIQIYYGRLPRRSVVGEHGIDAYDLMLDIFKDLPSSHGFTAVVEGAAYNRRFRQVELEETRFGFFLGLYHSGFNAKIIPPVTIRKRAFGSGKTQAGVLWPTLNQNAADSMGCAIHAALL